MVTVLGTRSFKRKKVYYMTHLICFMENEESQS